MVMKRILWLMIGPQLMATVAAAQPPEKGAEADAAVDHTSPIRTIASPEEKGIAENPEALPGPKYLGLYYDEDWSYLAGEPGT